MKRSIGDLGNILLAKGEVTVILVCSRAVRREGGVEGGGRGGSYARHFEARVFFAL